MCVNEFPQCPEGCQCELMYQTLTIICLDYPEDHRILLIQQLPTHMPTDNCASALDVSWRQLRKLHPGSFSNFPYANYLLLAANDLKSLDNGTFEGIVNLKVLDISNNSLVEISKDAFIGLVNLRQLYLDDNFLHRVTDGLFNNIPLEVLSATNNDFTSQNADTNLYGNHLKVLLLQNNNVIILSSEYMNEDLSILDMSSNSITSIELNTTYCFKKLTHLYLQNNDITYLNPFLIHSIPNVLVLNIANNHIQSLPSVLLDLPKLKRLQCDWPSAITPSGQTSNGLKAGGYSMMTGELFEKMTMGNSTVTRYSDMWKSSDLKSNNKNSMFNGSIHLRLRRSLGIHTNDTYNLSDRGLTELPQGIFQNVTSLVEINLSNNNLAQLPQGIFDSLTRLTFLKLYFNQLTQLPQGIFHTLTSLTSLTLGFNQLTKLPQSIFDTLTNLTYLDLGFNQLTQLQPGIFNTLTRLTYLSFYSNKLTQLPQGIFDTLTNLSSLHCGGNQITQLPQGIFDTLTNLTFLDLAFNQLSQLPQGIFDNLTRLNVLHLHFNQLTKLPESIFDTLTYLISLELGFNQLTQLPQSIFDTLVYLGFLNLEFNQLTQLPQGIFDNQLFLSTLLLRSNAIAELSGEIFAKLYHLLELRLDSNNLTSLPQGVFKPLQNLVDLHLSNNKLEELDVKTFQGLYQLSELHLFNNRITDLKLGTFDDIPNLNLLYLHDNMISNLSVSLFQNLPHLTDLWIQNNTLSSLPEGLFDDLSKLETLSFYNNIITNIDVSMFQYLHQLTDLRLFNTNISTLRQGIFGNLSNLNLLSLSDNMVCELHHDLFQNQHKLEELHLHNNCLSSLPLGIFDSLTNLKLLSLYSNKLSNLNATLFQNLTQLKNLALNDNNISSLALGLFDNLQYLEELWLYNNMITNLHSDLFTGLNMLQILALRNNEIFEIDLSLFQNQSNLRLLDFEENSITHIEGTFATMPNLTLLNLRKNYISKFDKHAFSNISNDTAVAVDSAELCCILNLENCLPKTAKTPFLSCTPLLPNIWLRISMWTLGVLALLANLFVIVYGIYEIKTVHEYKDRIPHIILITNLAMADLIMGIYMLIIAVADHTFGVNFPLHAEMWRNSLKCKAAGFLAVLSSEASLLFLTLISIERLSAFIWGKQTIFPHQSRRIAVVILIWLTSIALTSIPVALREYANVYIYDYSEVCIGLPLARDVPYRIVSANITIQYDDVEESQEVVQKDLSHKALDPLYSIGRPRDREILHEILNVTKGIQHDNCLDHRSTDIIKTETFVYENSTMGPLYSNILFLGVNSIFCFIPVICYVSIFLIVLRHRWKIVHRSVYQMSEESKQRLQSYKMALRMTLKIGLIVLTDLASWVPIIFIGIMVQLDKMKINPDWFPWIVAFVLPINSVINPFLYGIWIIVSKRNERKKKAYRPLGQIADTAV